MPKIKLIYEVRAVKSKEELANIIKVQRISEGVLQDVLKTLKTGVNEIEILNFIKKSFIKYLSAQAGGTPTLSFSPIVSFGKNTANIHHKPGRTKLRKGDIVMLDFGCTVNHYCSDMTRTYFWGKKDDKTNEKQKRIYLAVLKAQELALNKIKKGERRAKMIDQAARGFLNKKYKNKFLHGLGHGVGTVIHEWPNI